MTGNESNVVARRGLMLVLSSPSGAGKTTIARALLEREAGISMSVSATTRSPRQGETDGKDYHFVDVERFHRMVEAGEFLEHARVFNNFYGTPRAPVEATLAQGNDVLFDIDWQGTQQLGQNPNAQNDLVSVFILPPSLEELYRRLSGRGLDSPEIVAGRMARAGDEMSHWPEYDYIVVNDDLDRSIDAVRSILAAARLKRERQADLAGFVNRLRGLDRDSGG
ncbi:guanylate kinase [Magnetospirillum molischianum]|uniref:Guanylate kinase n=1 Tax=Magnetospirillum molischianum DSM 120 TaxID=1150626 RepID=H8FPN4_MAGML|nr:guanylate kinase [Magnetospirillum molischianum]CCG40322.1 Guanylate kinase (GMP kinase) [Magnetospirillum molischianum DSM 120]